MNKAISNTSCLGRILTIAAFGWVVMVSFGWQLVGGIDLVIDPVWAGLGQALTLALPLALLVFLWRPVRERSMFAAWLSATLYLLLLTPTRLFEPVQSQWVLLTQLLISLLVLGLLVFFGRPKNAPLSLTPMLLAAGAAAIIAYPWLWGGALGSLLDTLLALALGLVVGVNVGLILSRTWLNSLTSDSRGRGWDIFTGGLVIGAMLMIIASGLSFNSGQWRLMLVLPSLGWLAMALSYTAAPQTSPTPANLPRLGEGAKTSPGIEAGRTGSNFSWRAPALLTGLVTALIIAVMDTDGLSLLAGDSLAMITLREAAISMMLAWLVTIVALALSYFWGRSINLGLVAGGAALLWLIGLVLYVAGGYPGFYGDRLFVVLKDQADVSAAASIDDYHERRQVVYTTLVNHAHDSQADLRWLLGRLGIGYQSYYLVNAIEVKGGLLARLLLATRPEVDRVLYSPRLRPIGTMETSSGSPDAPSAPQWNLTNIGADRAWNELGVRGAGIVVGQSDSGVQWDHPELIDGYLGKDGRHDYHWFDPWNHTAEPVDFGGHGTHTLGSVLGQSVGVAPDADWIACANLARNVGNSALYLDCWQFLLAPFPQDGDPFSDGDPAQGADIFNNSWGCPADAEGCDPEVLRPAAQALRAAGVFVEVSAGNDGPACSTVQDPPAIYDEVTSTGAVDEFNDIAPFSSAGPVTVDGSGRIKPDIAAPGMQVLSAFPNSTYAELDGTSMAGPHITGVVALMWSANPNLIGDIDRTEQILAETATPFTGGVAGIDMEAALNQVLDENTTQQVIEELPDTPPQPDYPAACLSVTDLSQMPNNIVGYGVVNAYEAVKKAMEAP
ncbi:MAG: S8 family serine peptidase [Anaerolineales bacterium]|nr:S8 family serine peptidase [Anaerolineales bacterium]